MDNNITYGILTVSDRCSRGESEDKSGPALEKYISGQGKGVSIIRKCVPDETDQIKAILEEWCDNKQLHIILTTGGTGFSPRDVTPEATKAVITKEASGMVIAMIQGSLGVTPMAMLSRPVCGVRDKTLIVNLPGSAKGSLENYQFVEKQLTHAVNLLRDQLEPVQKQHQIMMNTLKTKIDPVNVADRVRKSIYPTIPVTVAQNLIMEECANMIQIKTNLSKGLGFVLAEDVFAKDSLPPFPASIKDGYAVKATKEMNLLNVLGDSTAGENPEKCHVKENFCVRISTGAPVPPGADAVIQIEDTELVERTSDGNEEKVIRIMKNVAVGQDIRPIGSDIREGEKVLTKGTKLGPVELGILAAVGVHEFLVYKKPTIAILSTGNELQNPNEKLEKGKIRDSNKTTLDALFVKGGFSTVDIGVAKDTPQEVLEKIYQGLSVADILVSTGGVSMGERDYLKRVLTTDLGATIHFGSVLMKPGKPTTFATCNFHGQKKIIFGLPGNPVSATVTAHLFAIPACKKLSGWPNPFYTTIKAKVENTLKLDKTRPEYHRTTLIWSTEDGVPQARSTGNQISSRLMSFNAADALLELPQGTDDREKVNTGEVVNAILITMT